MHNNYETGSNDSRSSQGFYEKSPGDILKENRLQYELTLDDVSSILNIRTGLLEAIEEGRYNELPASVYTIGFIKSYADYLRLDSEHLVMLFKRQTGLIPKEIPMDMPEDVSLPNLPTKKVIWAGAAGVIVLFIIVIFWLSGEEEKQVAIQETPSLEDTFSPEEIEKARQTNPDLFDEQKSLGEITNVAQQYSKTRLPSVKPKREDTQTQDMSLIDVQNLPNIYGAYDQNVRVVLKATAESWVQIQDGQKRIQLSRVLKQGDQYLVPDDGKTYITTGNAGALQIYVDDVFKGTLGDEAEVLRGYLVTPEGLIKE